MTAFTDLPPSLIGRLEEIERELKLLKSGWSPVVFGPGGTLIATNGLAAPVAGGGALTTTVNVTSITPPAPSTQTGVDDLDGVFLQLTPPSLTSDQGQIVEWQYEVTFPVPHNRLAYRDQEHTPTVSWSAVSGGSIGQWLSDAYSGYGCARLLASGSAAVIAESPTVGLTPTGTSQMPGAQFTASVWCKRLAGSRNASVSIRWYAGGSYLSESAGSTFTLSSSGWTNVTVTGTAPGTATHARVRVSSSTGSTNDSVLIDHAVLWAGSSTATEEWRTPTQTQMVPAGRPLRFDELPSGQYCEVRVRGVSRLGVTTQWSAGTLVLLASDTAAPQVAPAWVQVARGTRSLTVWWSTEGMPNDVLDGGWFEAMIATDAGFTQNVQIRKAITRVSGFNGLTLNGQYWVAVRAVDRAGNAGPWGYPTGNPYTITGAVDAGPGQYEAFIVEAVIGDAEIGSAKIRDLTADKLKAGSIGAETIVLTSVNSILKSSNFSGSTGWQIDGSGNATFRSIEAAGTITTSWVENATKITLNPTIPALQFLLAGTESSRITSYSGGLAFQNNGGGTLYWYGNTLYATAGAVDMLTIGSTRTIDVRSGNGTFSNLLLGYKIKSDGGVNVGYRGEAISGTWHALPAIQIQTNTYWAGSFADHTGFLIQCDGLTSWGNQALRFHIGTSWATYDANSSFAISQYVYARMYTGSGYAVNTNDYGLLMKVTSKAELKTRIEDVPAEDAVGLVMGLRPRRFVWKAASDDPAEQEWLNADPEWGFIVEEVADVSHRLVQWSPESLAVRDDLSKWSPGMWRERGVIALLTRVVQDLVNRVTVLEQHT